MRYVFAAVGGLLVTGLTGALAVIMRHFLKPFDDWLGKRSLIQKVVAACATCAVAIAGASGIAYSSRSRTAALHVDNDPADVVCDGQRREFAVLTNALPLEGIEIQSTPREADLANGTADSDGRVTLYWLCDASRPSPEWNLSFRGMRSGRVASATVRGVRPGDPTSTSGPVVSDPTTTSSGSLSASVVGSFVCDGTRGEVGELTGAAASEQVTFSSPGVPDLGPGTADANGHLVLHWSCNSNEAGTTWTVTATGSASGRSTTFTVHGA